MIYRLLILEELIMSPINFVLFPCSVVWIFLSVNYFGVFTLEYFEINGFWSFLWFIVKITFQLLVSLLPVWASVTWYKNDKMFKKKTE